MLRKLERLIPTYLKEKFTGLDVRQVDALPEDLRWAIIHGTREQALGAIRTITKKEKLLGKELLGQAAWDLLNDERVVAKGGEGFIE